jgi:hypothetical protein
LIEIKQIKGQSETHPLLSPTDEFANFEILTYLLGDPAGRIPHVLGSYARQASSLVGSQRIGLLCDI